MTIQFESVLGLVFLAADTAEEEVLNPILPVLPEFIWSGVFFCILWFLMSKVLLPPIIEGRDRRRSNVDAGKVSLTESETELLRLANERQERLDKARAEGDEIMDKARSEAEAQRSEYVGKVNEQISQLRADAEKEIEQARTKAIAKSKSSISSMAVEAASKVLGGPVDAASSQSIVDKVLERNGN